MRSVPGTLLTVTSSPASDGLGFVGVVSVGGHEAYRTFRAHLTPGDALVAARSVLVTVLGGLLASREWGAAEAELGHGRSTAQPAVAARAPAESP